MPAFLLPLLASAAPGIAKTFIGLAQGQQAKKLQPENYVPPGFQEALALQRQAAGGGTPGVGQQINRINQGVANSVATVMRTGNNSASILGTLAGIDANRNDALSTLSMQDQQYQQQQKANLNTMLGSLAKYQQQSNTDFGEAQSALREAKGRNMFSGLEIVASAGANALRKGKEEDEVQAGRRR